MPADRQPRTMDNPYYDWSPIPTRPILRWPGNARVALCVIVNVERAEWLPPRAAQIPPSLVHRGPYPAVPDIHEVSPHEYGNRVGVYRIMSVLERHHIRGTVAMDAAAAELYPFLVKQCLDRNWEIIGHGVTASQMITERMSEEQEREYIRRSLSAVERAAGKPAAGWSGIDYGESSRTVRLLAEMGVRYVCDWPNDEQPYRMKVPLGEMVALPVMIELDDVFTLRMRHVSTSRLELMMIEAFDRLYQDGATTGRLLVLGVHPWLMGQPFRIQYLDRALAHMMSRGGVWAATGSEIVDWYLSQTS